MRAEIIGALSSVILIWGLTLWLIYEAILRVINKPDVDGKIMLITAVFGLCCNLIMMNMLHERPEGAGKLGHGATCGGHGPGKGHGGHGKGGHKAHDAKPQHSHDGGKTMHSGHDSKPKVHKPHPAPHPVLVHGHGG